MPKPFAIKSRFGEYSATFEFLNGEVIYVRSMKSWKGKYPKETYQELVDFYKNVSKADNIKLVFLTKTWSLHWCISFFGHYIINHFVGQARE